MHHTTADSKIAELWKCHDAAWCAFWSASMQDSPEAECQRHWKALSTTQSAILAIIGYGSYRDRLVEHAVAYDHMGNVDCGVRWLRMALLSFANKKVTAGQTATPMKPDDQTVASNESLWRDYDDACVQLLALRGSQFSDTSFQERVDALEDIQVVLMERFGYSEFVQKVEERLAATT